VQRDLILVLATAVIVVSFIVQGLTLEPVRAENLVHVMRPGGIR
jgi:NhaP-type Na+/H+ or K+/H+ antiporter